MGVAGDPALKMLSVRVLALTFISYAMVWMRDKYLPLTSPLTIGDRCWGHECRRVLSNQL